MLRQPAPLPTPEAPHDAGETAWRVWKTLTRIFATWRFFAPVPGDFWIATQRLGNDFVSKSRRLSTWREAKAVLADHDLAVLQFLRTIAQINRAQTNGLFRVFFFSYLAAPATVVFGLPEAFPDWWAQQAADLTLWDIVALLGTATAMLLLTYAGDWRAREILQCVELTIAERRLQEGGSRAILDGEPASDPDPSPFP
ncbi:MAG: hypothetical protein ACFB2Z_07565 [Maricaulaceae bacterium]